MQKPLILLIALLAAAQPALAQSPAAQSVHLRGTIVSSSAGSILLNTGSEKETVVFGRHMRLVGVVNSSLDKVAPGDFIGTTVTPQADGSLKALEVHIFSAALKGSGEAYRPWDKQQKSMMANATVHSVEQPHNMMANATVQRVGSGAPGRTVVLAFKSGTKTVTIPPNVPVVALEPGTKSLLTNGAHVFIIATRTADGLVARAISVGENGVVPPM
jgi:type 1 fimbria pilin